MERQKREEKKSVESVEYTEELRFSFFHFI